MPNRDKNTTPLLDPSEDARRELVRSARRHLANGGTSAEFAKEHGLPRTTVIGWYKGHDGPRGRPRKLPCFNETEILKLLLDHKVLHDWKSVKKLIRRQSGEDLSHKSVFRLLGRWGLNHRTGGLRGRVLLSGEPWQQPMDSVEDRAIPLEGMLWRIVSGRGVEAIMLTAGESEEELKQVADAAGKWNTGRRTCLKTDHAGLTWHLQSRQ